MGRPARLRYVDDQNQSIVIGTYGADDGLINTFTLINAGETGEVTRCIIEGSSDLLGRIPTDPSDFNADEPEIFVDYRDNNGSWVQIDRVFAESQGFVTNDGSFKNKSLYGFQRYTASTSVSITSGSVTTNIVDALQAVLNDANIDGDYVVVSPTDNELQNDASTSLTSRPSVGDYTLKGPARKAFRDLTRNYGYLLWFTDLVDGSGNRKVFFEPKGYGSTIKTFDRDAGDGVYVVNWTKDDSLNYITEATVFGTDQSGNKYSGSASASPNDGKSVRHNIPYLQSDSEASSIADRLLDSDRSEHGKIDVAIETSNFVNGSFGLVDSRFSINGTFSAVWQKRSFHDGKMTLSFEYEGILRERDRDDRKFQNDRNNELVSQSDTQAGLDVGSANADTSPSGSNDSANADTSPSGSNDSADADTSVSIDTNDATDAQIENSYTSSFSSESLTADSWNLVADTGSISESTMMIELRFQLFSFDTNTGLNIAITTGSAGNPPVITRRVDNARTHFQDVSADAHHLQFRVMLAAFDTSGFGDGFEVYLNPDSGATAGGEIEAKILSHDHSGSITPNGHGSSNDVTEHQWSGSTTPNGHGSSADATEHQWSGSTTPNGHGSSSDKTEHGGNTDNITVADQTKEDR